MNLRYIQFAAIIFWGFRADLMLFALPMAIINEAQYFTDRRWALTRADFYRVADLTGLGLVGLVLFLFMNRADYHFITALIQWLPLLFYPLVVVLAFSTTERMPLDVLFYSLRRQSEPVTQSWDMNYVFFGLCLVAAGTTRDGSAYYLVVVAALVFLALFSLRSQRYSGSVWLLLALVTFLAGNLTQHAIRGGHLELQERSRAWLANYIRDRTNPLRTKSSIGTIGILKASDEIEFRVRPIGDAIVAPRLLQEATFDTPYGPDWLVTNPQFERVSQAQTDFTWRFGSAEQEALRANIYLEFNRETALVPVPSNLREIFDLPALEVKQSKYGSIQAQGLVPSPGFEVEWGGDSTLNAAPSPQDLFVPADYRALLEKLLPEAPDNPAEAQRHVRDMLGGFRYSLFQNVPEGRDPLALFLTETKAGHCEYFASATVLALRQQGVPARYAVGYSVQEYDPMLGMYVVRKRHAHAWAIAYLDGSWQVVDTTPQVWAEAESQQAGLLRPIADLLSNGLFMSQLWWSKQRLEDYETELYVLGGILVLILIWRIATSEQVRIGRGETEKADDGCVRHGLDSPFFQVETYLEAQGFNRSTGEPLDAWVRRIGHPELGELVSLHNQLRFDPEPQPAEVTTMLSQSVENWLSAQRELLAVRSGSV